MRNQNPKKVENGEWRLKIGKITNPIPTSNQGFTLIELSVVIVIIGLIVAGIVAGQSLVKQAQLRGIVSDVSKYSSAHNTFILQYNARAGDMSNASDFWPGCNSGQTNAQCNGDGNRQVFVDTDLADNEALHYWQHLSLAKIINGSYSGTASSAGTWVATHVTGVNAPKDSRGGCIGIHYRAPATWVGGNTFRFGPPDASHGGCVTQSYTAQELVSLETKLGDDGKARSGRLFVGGSCNSGDTYLLSSTNLCSFEISIEAP